MRARGGAIPWAGATSTRATTVVDAATVALSVLPTMSQKLIPKLDKLKAGSRVVYRAFAISGMTPDKVLKVTSTDDDVERQLYLYTVPLKRAKPGGR